MRYDLNNCSKRYTGKGKNETELYEAAKSWGVDPKAEMYKLPAIYVGAYAEKEKKELEESYKESRRQTEERKSKEWINGYNKWKKNK